MRSREHEESSFWCWVQAREQGTTEQRAPLSRSSLDEQICKKAKATSRNDGLCTTAMRDLWLRMLRLSI